MKRAMKTLIVICLALALWAGMSSDIVAATAECVWVNGMELSDGDYLAANDSLTVTAGATEEPATYVAWYCNGTLMLNNAEISRGADFTVDTKSGVCGISAEGDVRIELRDQNEIKSANTDFYAAIFVHGNLEIFSQNEGVLECSGAKASIYSLDGDLAIGGDADIRANCSCGFSDDLGIGALCSENGDVLISDFVIVKTTIDDGDGVGPNVAEMCAVNGNITICGYVTIDMADYGSPMNNYGIYASTAGSLDNGNILISDGVYLYMNGIGTGLVPDGDLKIGKNSIVIIWNANCGIYDARSITFERCGLEFENCSIAICSDSLFTLKDAYMVEAGYFDWNKSDMQYGDDLSAISMNDKNWYLYNGYRIERLLILPIHSCAEFSDYESWNWASPYNCFVIENGIMGSVYSDSDYFNSNGTVTRGMVVAVMYRLCGSPELSQADYDAYNNKFTDVEKGQWYYDPVVWAYNNSVTEGKTSTTFAPSEETSREQIVTFFWRFCEHLGYDNSGDNVLNGYSDLNKVNSYAVDAFRWSVTYGIVKGTSNTELSPKSPCTRGQMARIIYGFVWLYLGDQNWIDIGWI